MRIGIDARLWNETGVGRYIRALYQYLPEGDEYVWFLGEKEYKTLELKPGHKKVLATSHWHTVTEQLTMPWLFYKENLDLLHVPYVNFPTLYLKKTISTIHDLIPDHYKTGRATTLPIWFYWFKKLGYHLLVWIAAKRAARILTLSNDAKNEIVEHYRVSPKKVTAIHEAGTLEDKRTRFVEKEYKKYEPYILYVGNAHPHKNVESLIRAMDYLPDLKLVLVGNDSFFFPRLPQHKRVIKIGFVQPDKIAGWYHFASAFVTASKMEGFGIPPLEAMSVGCPAIVSDIPVFHEVYGDAAVYFDQNDPKNIAEVIDKTLKNKKLVTERIERGYKQSAKYSWQKLVLETSKVYHSV